MPVVRSKRTDPPQVRDVVHSIASSRRGMVNSHPGLPRASCFEHALWESQTAEMSLEEYGPKEAPSLVDPNPACR
jgi:hypothetical protein